MAEREDIIFDLKLEGADALTEMERFKKSILQTKQEQQELTKAYKQGNITLDEFVQDSVRLEAILKKQQSSYNNVQKSVTGVKTQMDKLIDSNKKISKSFEETAKEINVAGFSIGDLTAKVGSFMNPATAAVGVVGALTAVYLKSTTGAKDFAFAQERLTFLTDKMVNAFGRLVGGTGEQGTGPLSKTIDLIADFTLTSLPLFNLLLGDSVRELLNESKAAAQAAENLERLNLAAKDAAGFAKTFEQTAEQARRVRDDTSQELETRLKAISTIEQNINASGIVRINNLKERREAIKGANEDWENNLAIQGQIKDVDAEIRNIEEEITGKLTENRMALLAIRKEQIALDTEVQKYIDSFVKSLDAERVAYEKRTQLTQEFHDTAAKFREDAAIQEVDTNAAMNNMIAAQNQRTEDQAQAGRIETLETTQAVEEAQLQSAATVLNAITGLADEGSEAQKMLALTAITADTAAAVVGGIKAAQSVPFPGNLVAMASTIAAVLAAISNARSAIGFAEGGWTGPGSKHEARGIVHADEYVTPKHIVHSAAAQPYLVALENMRLRGYADGGLVTNSLTAEVNQNMMMANMLKMMPTPVLDQEQTAMGLANLRVKVSGEKPFRQ